ncbi:hypothetical protein E4U54_005270 [Claviceps lovelessii]|nr:hypothetical protein E4U54_005270 [Claviceps lovelessii]
MLFNVLLALACPGALAHFALTFPPERFDTLSEAGMEKYSQWTHPCAGVPYQTGNVTDWPLTGGSLQLSLHHPWTYVFVNLGLGPNTTDFNVTLTPELWNVTGKGTLCVDKLALPANLSVQDGALASLQVVTVGESGSALYNCADIRLRRDLDAAASHGNCTSSPGMVVQTVRAPVGEENKVNGAGTAGAHLAGLVTVVGLATAFAMGA